MISGTMQKQGIVSAHLAEGMFFHGKMGESALCHCSRLQGTHCSSCGQKQLSKSCLICPWSALGQDLAMLLHLQNCTSRLWGTVLYYNTIHALQRIVVLPWYSVIRCHLSSTFDTRPALFHLLHTGLNFNKGPGIHNSAKDLSRLAVFLILMKIKFMVFLFMKFLLTEERWLVRLLFPQPVYKEFLFKLIKTFQNKKHF